LLFGILIELSFQITDSEINDAIITLKAGKAAGSDNISGEIIKASAPIILPILKKMFNCILTKGTYPKEWAEGMISPIHKKGSKLNPDNYRGITVSSCLAKVFGIVMNNRLKSFCDKHSLIDERQSSHRKNCRTTDNIFILKSLFEKHCLKESKKLYACFIDFRKAFDFIWHDALFLKLQRLGIGGPFYNVIKNMYSNVTSSVKCGKLGLTNSFQICRGVKQGDMLSPLLFNLFINDIIPLFQQHNSHPPCLIEKEVGSLLYADDLVILSSSPQGLQNSLDKLDSYCKKWKLEVNLSKSKMMCFNRYGKHIDDEFSLGNEKLELVTSYPYLGIEISNNCSFKLAQKTLADKAMRALFKLKNLLFDSNTNPTTSIKLFDQLIKPICMYGSEIWGADLLKTPEFSKLAQSIEKLACEKLNLSICRFILGVHKKSQISAIRGELGRAPLGTEIISNMIKYKEYLHSKDKTSVLYEALKLCESMPESTSHTKYWISQCNKIKEVLHSSCDNQLNLNQSSKKQIKLCINSLYTREWENKISQESKMRTYNVFKNSFVMEDYLSLKNEHFRKALTKLRISAHTLAIEKGRYTIPPTPAIDRICKHCPGRRIEDEYHFLMDCKKFSSERNKLFNFIEKACPQFKNIDDNNKFIYMMSSGTDIAEPVARFVYNHLP